MVLDVKGRLYVAGGRNKPVPPFETADKHKAGVYVFSPAGKLLKFVPDEFKKDAHHWLILHGRYTCIARKPRCGSCVIEDLCEYRHKSE